MHAPDATHGMQFTNETLHFVVLFAVPIRDERTDGGWPFLSYHSDTNERCFRLSFAAEWRR
jgi:hypothetical protein